MYPDFKSRSKALYDRALASLPGGNTRTTVFMKPYPIYAARGEGCRVWDVDGNELIDCINNFTSLIHGHAHPALIEAAMRQLALGSAFGLPTESEIDLAELLVLRLPSVDQVLCVPKTLSTLMRWQNRLSWRNDWVAVFIPCSRDRAMQVEEPA